MILALAGLVWGCSPATQLTKSWVDPNLNASNIKPFTKVLVIARIKDATGNRIAEDDIVKQMKCPAVQSYQYLEAGDSVQSVVDAKLKKDGFDGVIVMKLTNVNKSLDYQPGYSYGGWYGYRYGSPGYLSVDQTFYVETSIYSLVTGKLVWSGVTSSLNPTDLEQTLGEIITAIKNDLVQKGLIKPDVTPGK